MITVYVPDVGDGLAAGLRTIGNASVQIDCGSQQNADIALEKGLYCIDPDVFFLSHFHTDHYNGLLCCNNPPRWRCPAIRETFFPRVPKFRQRETFMRYMLAMSHWVMGDTSGSMAADFLGVMSRINRRPFTYRSLSMGDTVDFRGSQLEVLWPPPVIDEDDTLKVIATAITDFEAAAEEDETLRQILETIGERGEVRPYMSDETEGGELPGHGEKNHDGDRGKPRFPLDERNFPEAVRKANASLRTAANHISLALHEDNKFLFKGDLEGHEIGLVVEALARKKRDHFLVTVTPHHGTHWHKRLRRIHTCYSISSVGSRLFRHLSPKFKSISDVCLITHLNGDVEVPVFFPTWYGPRHWRLSRTFL